MKKAILALSLSVLLAGCETVDQSKEYEICDKPECGDLVEIEVEG
jgi:uncharacterized lipoprotein YehR (DUF1307 family)